MSSYRKGDLLKWFEQETRNIRFSDCYVEQRSKEIEIGGNWRNSPGERTWHLNHGSGMTLCLSHPFLYHVMHS